MPASERRDRALVLINPRARLAGRRGWRDEAVAALASRYAVELVAPSDANDTTRSALEAAGDGYSVIVAAGGDGTVNAVAQGLCGTATALGILPLGSANDLARELGIPRSIPAAARRIAGGTPRAADLAGVGDRIFCGVGGVALVARATLAVMRLKQRSAIGRWGANLLGGGIYRVSATAALIDPGSIDEEIRIAYREPSSDTWRERETRVSALFVTNHRTLGGGMVLPVDADASDGVLEICLVPSRPRLSLMLNFARLSAGRQIPEGVLVPVRATEMTIETGRADAFVADGELLARGSRFDVRVLPRALRVIW
jgi:diacylglycerol kinase (ATP)